MVQKTVFAVSEDATRKALNGVYFHNQDEMIYMVATDGHRLGSASRSFVGDDVSAIIPKKALDIVARATNSSEVSVSIGESLAVFTCGDTVVTSKLVEGPYPKYNNVIPKSFNTKLNVNREQLIELIKRANCFSNEHKQVILSMSNDVLVVSARDVGAGAETSESMDAELYGSELTIGFKGQYLVEILNLCGTETVTLSANSPTGACVIDPEGTSDVFFLLMPLRIASE
jgi:DNA polymerase-3 subunit beta